MTNEWLMANEAVKYLSDNGYPRSIQWLKAMVGLGKIRRQKKSGRNFYHTAELNRVIENKLKLKVVVSSFAALMILAGSAFAEVGTPQYFNSVVDAIYLAEGGEKARKPFGILSVPCEGYDECRRICLNTVRNNWGRWQKAGAPGEYIDFLANRYAPPGGIANDPKNLNQNWPKNVRYFLAKNEG